MASDPTEGQVIKSVFEEIEDLKAAVGLEEEV
jgi:hypothetical protein